MFFAQTAAACTSLLLWSNAGFRRLKQASCWRALEREGKVRRVKKGRDKIVNLVEQSKAKNNAG